jgi:DNA mismatch endonuclease, patch repair protein
MRAIRGKNTGPELLLRQQLRLAGILGYRIHNSKLPGSPDIAISSARLAVFVDGVFWHGHSSKFRKIRTEHWRKRIRKNMSRDRRIDRELKAQGWTVMRVWDLEVLSDSVVIAQRIAAHVRARRNAFNS